LKLISSEPEIVINVDAQRLLQVLSNLITNAIKYSTDGGEVAVLSVNKVIQFGFPSPIRPWYTRKFSTTDFHKFAQADSSDTRQKRREGRG